MESYEYLEELISIEPDNKFLKYIAARVQDNDYRGFQCSQHNRLTYQYFYAVLCAIDGVAGDSSFFIHIGDDKGKRQPAAETYYRIVDEIKASAGRGTINSIKKNIFPDIARMGFIDRFDKHGSKLLPNRRGVVYSVKLSALGREFIEADTFKRVKLFTDGVDRLTKNTASELVEMLYLNDYGIDYLDIHEYMYIYSDDRGINPSDKLELLLEYRRLTPAEREQAERYLQLYCDPENWRGQDKTVLRDYSNWKNESQQIFLLFASSTYFKVERGRLVLNTGSLGLFDPKTVRGEKAKNNYFSEHGISRDVDYELHHIVPFSKAMSKADLKYIDDYKNLIYLSKAKHAQFTALGSKSVIMTQLDEHRLAFTDFTGNEIVVDIRSDTKISTSRINDMLEYNKKLLKKFYYV